MNTKTLTAIIVIAAILLLGGCGCSGYNKMVSLDQNVKVNGEMCRVNTREEPTWCLTW